LADHQARQAPPWQKARHDMSGEESDIGISALSIIPSSVFG